MVVGGSGTPLCRQPDGRRSCFEPCTPGWFSVSRLACGLSTVKWRLKLWCGWCAVLLAASWLAWSACVSSRCCRWLYRRMLFVQPARPCPRWLVPSWLVQVRRSAVCQRWLGAFVMVELRCSVVFVGMVVSGRGPPRCCHPVGRSSRFDPCKPALVWCWPACVWSVYGHVAAAAAVWLMRGCRGRLMVGWVRVGSVALLLVVLSSNPACVAGTSVSVLAICVLVCPSVL